MVNVPSVVVIDVRVALPVMDEGCAAVAAPENAAAEIEIVVPAVAFAGATGCAVSVGMPGKSAVRPSRRQFWRCMGHGATAGLLPVSNA